MTAAAAMLFDLDGTMLDTAPDMGGALNRLLEEQGRAPLSAAVIRPVVSHGAARLVKLGFPGSDGEEFERLRLRFLDLYSRHLAVETLPLVRSLDDMHLVLLSSGRFDRQLGIGSVSNPGSNTWEFQLGDERAGAGQSPGKFIAPTTEGLGDFHQLVDDVDVLRAFRLAFAALQAI